MNNSHIVIAIPPNERLFSQYHNVLQFANAGKCTVTLLSVIDSLEYTPAFIDYRYTPEEIQSDAECSIFKQLEEDRAALNNKYPDIAFDCVVVKGKAFIAILTFCHTNNVDFIVTRSGTKHKLNRGFFSSTTKHLMRKSPVPIWATANTHQTQSNTIVAAIDIDFGEDKKTTEALNHQIIQHALQIAKYKKLTVQVLHVWKVYGKEFAKHWSNTDPDYLTSLMEKEYTAREEALKILLQGYDSSNVELVMIEGDAKSDIAKYIVEKSPFLLVMGTVCRTGLPSLLIGNTAETILDTISCNVLTVKPKDFVSPVQ